MRGHLDSSVGCYLAYIAALVWIAAAAPAFASPLDGLLSGPAGSNATSASSGGASSTNSGAAQPVQPIPVPLTQRLDIALSGPVSASSGECPGTSCDGPGDCVAISFQSALAIGAAGPLPNGASGTGAMSRSAATSLRGPAKAAGKTSIRTGGIGALRGFSVCVNVDVDVQTPNGSGGVCMPASGTGMVNSETFTAAGELCTDANPAGSLYTLSGSYGIEDQAPPGAGNLIEAIDANSGTATLLMGGTIGPNPAAVPPPTSGGKGGLTPK
jgi:hypothetical protein